MAWVDDTSPQMPKIEFKVIVQQMSFNQFSVMRHELYIFACLQLDKPIHFQILSKKDNIAEVKAQFNRTQCSNLEMSLVDNRCLRLTINFA